MQRQLWTLSGLATELGRDRRTVARALDGVPPDGMVGRNRAWFMVTALKRLNDGIDAALIAGSSGGALIENIRHRLSAWRSIYSDAAPSMALSEVAQLLGVGEAQLLARLRAGMPYAAPGDWTTGRDFQLRLAWTIEWSALVESLLARAGDRDLVRQLGFA